MSTKTRLEDYYNAETSEEERAAALAEFAEPRTSTQQATGDTRRHTDADSIRREFGIPRWDREAFEYPSVIPNCWEKSWDAPVDETSGGTDFLARGKPGSGKSTLANYVAAREMDVNDAAVVWRGSSARSEWLPLAPWTRLCLPEGVTPSIRLVSKDKTKADVVLGVDDLEGIVREVVRYRDPLELLQDVIEPGQLHVVYPDPRMRGCQDIYESVDEKVYDGVEFTPEDPATHWWFAWMLARVEYGPYDWMAWILDEVGDLAPQSASSDEFGTYGKVELMRDSWVDARKTGLSIYMFGHSETDIHEFIRRKVRWRIQMRGTANPTRESQTVGFESIPMNSDLTSRMPLGKALMYTETNFESFRWKNMPSATDYKLKLKVS